MAKRSSKDLLPRSCGISAWSKSTSAARGADWLLRAGKVRADATGERSSSRLWRFTGPALDLFARPDRRSSGHPGPERARENDLAARDLWVDPTYRRSYRAGRPSDHSAGAGSDRGCRNRSYSAGRPALSRDERTREPAHGRLPIGCLAWAEQKTRTGL